MIIFIISMKRNLLLIHEILIHEINIKMIIAIVARVKGNIVYSSEREYSVLYIHWITNDI